MNALEYAWRADPDRRSRLHDLKGNRLPAAQYTEIPVALVSTIARWLFRYRPAVPWIPRPARHAIEQLLRPESKVLEFGSGMSTLWLARRCAEVYAVEHDATWQAVIARRLTDAGLAERVRYELRSLATYADLPSVSDGYFDYCVIDGAERAACARTAVAKVRRGGYVYWDNSDNTDPDADGTDAVLLAAFAARGGTCQVFIGFPPTTFHVTQGRLYRLD
jgi:hypothetical protein